MRLVIFICAILACDPSSACPEVQCCEPTRSEFIVHNSGSLPAPTAELNFYRLALKDAGEVRLPSVEQVSSHQELYIINVGAPVDVFAPAGSELNGVMAGVPWLRLRRSLGVFVRKQNATAFAGVQGEAAP